MASINLEPPISPPAHEWASNTADALDTTSEGATQPMRRSQSPTQELGRSADTPGLDFPGAFPRDSYSSQLISEERTPHAAAVHLAEAAPPKSTSDIQESAKSYLPSVDVQYALDTARAYLPHGVVGAVGSVLPTNSGQTEKDVDPTSGAKPASDEPTSWATTSLDAASTTALAPSTRSDSLNSSTKGGSRTPIAEGAKPGVVNALDVTSQAKPGSSNVTSSDMPNAPASASKAASTNVAAREPLNTLPTPPDSSDGTEPVSQTAGTGTGERVSSDHNDSEVDGSRHPVEVGPTPPPKDDTVATDYSISSQPKVNVTPAQGHIKSGTAGGTRFPGTALGGGNPSTSPKSELSDAHIHEDNQNDASRESKSNQNAAAANSSDEGLDVGGKKEGPVKKVVHKVKDKFTHRNH